MLRLERISVAYGKHEALHDVTLDVPAGRTTVILGANGAGKTTLLKTVGGLVRPRPGGRILFQGRPIESEPPHRLVAAGIALVPEGRRLFGDMTVIDNLRMGAYTPHARPGEARRLDKQLALFPILEQRRSQIAKTMSGGEQQMLAIARALMSEPKLLLLDEPSLGLSPRLVKELFAALRTITSQGQSVVLVEQNVRQSLRLADLVYVLENGHIVRSGVADDIEKDAAIQKAYLGLASQRADAEVVVAAVPCASERVHHPGGFVNPFSRSVSVRDSDSRAHAQEKDMAGLASSTVQGGFFHPGARSVAADAAAKQTAATHAEPATAVEAKDIPTSGGFVNPQARTAKQ
jgi:branched-chain amino acid transport system ATP-binding protein